MSRLSDFISAAGAGLDISALTQNALTEDRVVVFEESGTWTAPDDGYLFIRGWGAGGGGSHTSGVYSQSGGDTTINISGVGSITLHGGGGGRRQSGTSNIPTIFGGSVSASGINVSSLSYSKGGDSGYPRPSQGNIRTDFPRNPLSTGIGASNGQYGGGGGNIHANPPLTGYELYDRTAGGGYGASGGASSYVAGSVVYRVAGGAGGAILNRNRFEVRGGGSIVITIGAGGAGGNYPTAGSASNYGMEGSSGGILLDFWTYDEVDALIIAAQG